MESFILWRTDPIRITYLSDIRMGVSSEESAKPLEYQGFFPGCVRISGGGGGVERAMGDHADITGTDG